ncbi:MAG: hypothetical protein ABIN99_01130 [Nitrosospira sp.]
MANNVTAGYIISDVERLRELMQRISNFLLASMHASTDTATVTDTDKVRLAVRKNNHDSRL